MAVVKKTRFRFSESERLRAIQELFINVCQDVANTEEELWQNIHAALCRDIPRFKSCSLRLLKEHLVEQVNKFKKYDSVEATESGRERLNSEWGSKMRALMSVWPNYQQLTQSARKVASKRKQMDTEVAKKIPDAALGIIEFGNSGGNDDFIDGECDDIPINERSENMTLFASTTGMQNSNINPTELNSPEEIEQSSSSEYAISRKYIKPARKSRKKAAKGVWQYLAETSLRESEIQLRIHEDNIKMKYAELKYKQDKLEFEKEKWKVEIEERKKQMEVTDSLCKILMTFANNSCFNK